MLTINYTIKRGAPRQYFNIWQYSTINWSKPWSLTVQLYGVEHRGYNDGHQLTYDADGCATDRYLFNNYSSSTPILFMFKCR